MKFAALSLLIPAAVIVAFGLSTGFAAAPTAQAFSHPVKSVERFGENTIVRGSKVIAVVQALGQPHHKLSPEVWVYLNFNGGHEQPATDNCTTLLVTFTDGSVDDLQLVNQRAEKIFAARMNLGVNANVKVQVAAK